MSKIYTILYDENSPELDLNSWYATKGNPVLPNYKTNSASLQWMTGATGEQVGTMVQNPNVDISANKIVLSDNIDWDVENQLVIFAKQKMIFDGNGMTINLVNTGGIISRSYGIIAPPHRFTHRLWNDSLNDADGYKGKITQYRSDIAESFDHIKDIDDNETGQNALIEVPENEDPYGVHVKNLIIDANDIDLQAGTGYLFGFINKSNNDNHSTYYGYYGGGGRPMVNENVTKDTKNCFIVEKCQIKAKKSSVDSNNYSGSFVGSLSGRGKFINCISNHRFFGRATYGWWEIENCFINSDESFTDTLLNRQYEFESRNNDRTTADAIYPPVSDADKKFLSHRSYHKYIFKNSVAQVLYLKFYTGITNPNIAHILEVINCKVQNSNVYNQSTAGVESNAFDPQHPPTTGFAYLSGSSVDTSKLNDILEEINSDNAFTIENNEITLQFSPYVGISMDDYLTVVAIDLSASNIVESSSIPNTWFSNLVGTTEEEKTKEKDKRRHQLIDTIFANNTSIETFDISKSVIAMTTHAMRDTYRVFKLTDASANVDLCDISENTGFYIPLINDNDKVDITTRSNDITFELKRSGLDTSGNNIYYITKKSGTSNIIIDRSSSFIEPVSSNSTTKETLITTSYTYNNQSNNENTGQTTNICLTQNTTVNVVSSGGNKYVFNGGTTYDSNNRFGLYITTYTFKDIPYAHPMALLNNNNSNISYSVSNDVNSPIIIKVSGGNTSETNGDFYVFKDANDNTINIGNGTFRFMRGKTYKFQADGISTSHPFKVYMSSAFVNDNNSSSNGITDSTDSITITIPTNHSTTAGDLYYQCGSHSSMKKNLSLFYKSVTGTTNDASYDFFYGDITVIVSGEFGNTSVYCYHHGYMGGENLLEYKASCSP